MRGVETLNGFPYGSFHGERVKERVFQPDWTTPERFEYTCNLFRILALIGDERADTLTVSTLPASHSWFHADEERIFARLEAMSGFLDALSRQTGLASCSSAGAGTLRPFSRHIRGHSLL